MTVHFSYGRCGSRSPRTSELQVEGGSSLVARTVEGGLGRAAGNGINTITGHGCVKLEGHHRNDQRAPEHDGDQRPRGLLVTCGDFTKFVSRRADEWSVIDCDPCTQDPNLPVGSALCKNYQKGWCKFGGRTQVSARVSWKREHERRAKASPRKVATHSNFRVTRKARLALEKC